MIGYILLVVIAVFAVGIPRLRRLGVSGRRRELRDTLKAVRRQGLFGVGFALMMFSDLIGKYVHVGGTDFFVVNSVVWVAGVAMILFASIKYWRKMRRLSLAPPEVRARTLSVYAARAYRRRR